MLGQENGDIEFKIKGATVHKAKILLLMGGILAFSYFGYDSCGKRKGQISEKYHNSTTLDEEISRQNKYYLKSLATEIESYGKLDSDLAEQRVAKIYKNSGRAAAIGAIMAANNVNTSNIGEVQAALDNFCSEQNCAMNEVDKQFTISAAQALYSSKEGIAFKIGAEIYKEYKLDQQIKSDPIARQYASQHNGTFPSPEQFRYIQSHKYDAIPEDRTSPMPNANRIFGVEKNCDKYGNCTERTVAAPFGTPSAVENARRNYEAQRSNQMRQENYRQVQQDFNRAAGSAVDAGRNAASGAFNAGRQAAESAGKAANDFFNSLSQPQNNRRR
jgi:hypothetical protein